MSWRSNAIDFLMEHHFQTLARFLGILIMSAPSDTYEPLQHKGALQSVSPEEMRATFLLDIARYMVEGVPQAVLRDWV